MLNYVLNKPNNPFSNNFWFGIKNHPNFLWNNNNSNYNQNENIGIQNNGNFNPYLQNHKSTILTDYPSQIQPKLKKLNLEELVLQMETQL